MNRKLLHAVERRNHDQLAKAAHEVGHGLAEIAAGGQPAYVKLSFGMFGGFHGGECEWGDCDRSWPRNRQLGRLVAMMAGHAAETRFCQLYLGLDYRAAYRWGKDDCVNDYWMFRHWRRQFRLSLSTDRAFEQAMRLLERQAGRLDALTLRLERTHYLHGGEL